jgi:biopolymer transport protein ExbD
MPSVKIHKKSTDTDMTPFVDIAFLILSFFIMATKFKPPEPIAITTPNSVSSKEIPADDAVLITIDSTDRVFFSILSEKDKTVFDKVIENVDISQKLNLSPAQKANFRYTLAVGVPFDSLSILLNIAAEDQGKIPQSGIPVGVDTTYNPNNELIWWINAVKEVYGNNDQKLKYLIKGDGGSKYPAFEAVIAAFKKNDLYKYNLVTSLENAPTNSELDIANRKGINKAK